MYESSLFCKNSAVFLEYPQRFVLCVSAAALHTSLHPFGLAVTHAKMIALTC